MKLTITVLVVFALAGSAIADGRIYGTCDPGPHTETVSYTVDVYDDHATWMCADSQAINNVWKSDVLDDGAYRCLCTLLDSHGSVLATQARGWIYILGGNTECNFVFTYTPLSFARETWALIKTITE